MEQTKKSGRGLIWIVIALIIIVVAVIAGTYFMGLWGKSPPTLMIIQPTKALNIQSGQGVIFLVEGKDETGIGKIEFLVDDVPISNRTPSQPSQEVFQTSFAWFGTDLGNHKLTAVAYNQDGIASDPADITVKVTAIQPISVITTGAVDLGDSGVSGTSGGDTGSAGQSDQGGSSGSGSSGNPGDTAGQSDQGGSGEPGSTDGGADTGGQVQPPDNDQGSVDEGDERAASNNDEVFVPDDDLPPTVTLEVNVNRSGLEVIVIITAKADDDHGLTSLEVIGSKDGVGEDFHHLQPSDGEPSLTYTAGQQLSSGEWTIVAQAVDTGGQSSELVSRSVSIVPSENVFLPPSIGIENISLPNNISDQVNRNWQLNLQESVDPVIDFRLTPDYLYPDNVDTNMDPSGCLAFSAGETAEGIGLFVQVNCDINELEGNYIVFRTEQLVGEFGQAAPMPLDEWNSSPRTSLNSGAEIEVIDRSIACDTLYTYSLQAGYSLDYFILNNFKPITLPLTVSVRTSPCQGDEIGTAIFLDAAPQVDGNLINWGFSAGNWASQLELPLEYDSVQIRLFGFLPYRNIQYYIPIEQDIINLQNLPGTSYETIDTNAYLYCGEPIYYTLLVVDPGLGGIPIHTYAQKTVQLPPTTCGSYSGLRTRNFSVSELWQISTFPNPVYQTLYVTVSANFGGFDWPQGSAALNLLMSSHADNASHQRNELLSLSADSNRLRDYQLSEVFGPEVGIKCGGIGYTFFFELYGVDSGEFISHLVDSSQAVNWTSPLCPPNPPSLENLHAMSPCEGSSTGSCIIINWSPPSAQDDTNSELVNYKLFLPSGAVTVPKNLTTYLYETVKPDPRSNGLTYEFLISGCNSQGYCGYPSQKLNILIPPTLDTWDFWSFDYSASR